MTRRAVSTMCVLLLAFTLAACGSSKKSVSSSSAGDKSKASTTTEASSSSGDSTADKAKAEAINLKTDDFPSGWTSKPATTNNDSTDKELYTCSGLPDPATNTTATVSSPDFSQGTFTNASSEVRFAKSNDVAKKVLERTQKLDLTKPSRQKRNELRELLENLSDAEFGKWKM